jgi:hypothetical protein
MKKTEENESAYNDDSNSFSGLEFSPSERFWIFEKSTDI